MGPVGSISSVWPQRFWASQCRSNICLWRGNEKRSFADFGHCGYLVAGPTERNVSNHSMTYHIVGVQQFNINFSPSEFPFQWTSKMNQECFSGCVCRQQWGGNHTTDGAEIENYGFLSDRLIASCESSWLLILTLFGACQEVSSLWFSECLRHWFWRCPPSPRGSSVQMGQASRATFQHYLLRQSKWLKS